MAPSESPAAGTCGTIRNFPLALAGASEWDGLIDWMEATIVKHHRTGEADAGLPHRVDRPEETCALVEAACARQRDLLAPERSVP